MRRHSAGLRPKTTVEKTDAAGFRIGVVCRQKSGAAYSLGRERGACVGGEDTRVVLSLIHISEPTRLALISYAVFCLKKKKKK